MNNNKHALFSLKTGVTLGMLSALSVALVWLIHFPIIPATPFLEYDPADIPILIGTLLFGPIAGIVLTLAASIVQGLTVSAGSGIYGIIMHILATGTLTVTVGLIYRRRQTVPGLVMGLVCGVVIATGIMLAANLLITPYFMGVPVKAVKDLLLPAILPFNLIKLGVNALLSFALYKSVALIITKNRHEAVR